MIKNDMMGKLLVTSWNSEDLDAWLKDQMTFNSGLHRIEAADAMLDVIDIIDNAPATHQIRID